MSRVLIATIASLSFIFITGTSSASAARLCAFGPGHVLHLQPTGACGHGETTVDVPTSAELTALTTRVATLESKVTTLETANTELQTRLAGVSRSGNTLSFTGMNLQLKNGLGSTATTNGLGNLIIGYNDPSIDIFTGDPVPLPPQTGSHDLLLGTGNAFTSYAGIIDGNASCSCAPYASVFGNRNLADGEYANVLGGVDNHAAGEGAVVSGGAQSAADGQYSSVSGGSENHASGDRASISGGDTGTASGSGASISGGRQNTAGVLASVGGGYANNASGEFSWIGGGFLNTASADRSSLLGGNSVVLATSDGTYPAGP